MAVSASLIPVSSTTTTSLAFGTRKPPAFPSLACPFKVATCSLHYRSLCFLSLHAHVFHGFNLQGSLKKLNSTPCGYTATLRVQLRRPLSVVVNKAASAPAPAAGASSVRFRLDNLGPQPGSRKKAKRKGRGISAGQGASCGFGMRGQKSRSGPGVRKGFEGGQMPLYRRIPKLRGIAGGEGELSKKLTFKARAFSTSAKEKLESAGCSLTVLPGRKKWVKPSVAKNLARAEEYFAKKRAAAAASEPAST
ncbi:hypothetical protein AHAS_Ahas15G0257000 [Arachis hypogaea]